MNTPMDPKSKLKALINPQTLEDYGVSISETEMRTFPEGRAFLLAIRKKQRDARRIDRLMSQCGAQAAETVDRILAGVLVSK